MNNFFLFNDAVKTTEITTLKEGLSELVAIERDKEDSFKKHASIWNIPTFELLFADYGQAEQAIVKFIEQLTTIEPYLDCEETFDECYPNEGNAFLGIDFSTTSISINRQIVNDYNFRVFKDSNLWNISFRNLWSKSGKLFPNLVLCGDVQEQISRIGESSHFNQIVERLKALNNAVGQWNSGDFSYKEINGKFALTISPESTQTMAKYGNERKFKLPSGEVEYFELHIKTGDLRFHFYPDQKDKKVYVGYIGPHLSTISN